MPKYRVWVEETHFSIREITATDEADARNRAAIDGEEIALEYGYTPGNQYRWDVYEIEDEMALKNVWKGLTDA